MSVKRLTVKPEHDPTGRQFSWALCHERLSSIEDILGDDYDLGQLSVLVNQRMTMREDVAARMKMVGGIPLDRLRELVEANQEGRCAVLPCKPGGHMFEIFCGKVWEIIVCGFSIRNKREVVDYMRMHGGYVQCAAIEMDLDLFTLEMYKTREAAEAALKGWQDGHN